jgi:hypothetical protein
VIVVTTRTAQRGRHVGVVVRKVEPILVPDIRQVQQSGWAVGTVAGRILCGSLYGRTRKLTPILQQSLTALQAQLAYPPLDVPVLWATRGAGDGADMSVTMLPRPERPGTGGITPGGYCICWRCGMTSCCITGCFWA